MKDSKTNPRARRECGSDITFRGTQEEKKFTADGLRREICMSRFRIRIQVPETLVERRSKGKL